MAPNSLQKQISGMQAEGKVLRILPEVSTLSEQGCIHVPHCKSNYSYKDYH